MTIHAAGGDGGAAQAAPEAPVAPVAPEAHVHDLLRLRDPRCLEWNAAAPDWAAAALAAAPWVVVRRAAALPGSIAVGVRGARRSQRAAAWVRCDQVAERLGPEALRAGARRVPAARGALPALRSLLEVERAWGVGGPARWGPGGSVGFELATGHPAVHADSDLDLVVRCAAAPRPALARGWLLALPTRAPSRIDVVLEWPQGGAALREYAGGGSYLLRSAAGARLCPAAAGVGER